MGDPALPLRRFAEKGQAIGRLWAIAEVLRAQGDRDYADSLEEAAAHACALAVSLNRAEARVGALERVAEAARPFAGYVRQMDGAKLADAFTALDAIPTPSQGEEETTGWTPPPPDPNLMVRMDTFGPVASQGEEENR